MQCWCAKHDSSKGGLMPTYNDDFEWEGVIISGKPAGIQSLPGLGRVLRMWPLFTGSRRPFSIHIRAKDKKRRKNTVTLSWFIGGPGGGNAASAVSESHCLEKVVKIRAQPKTMMAMDEGQLRLWKLRLDTGEAWGDETYEDLIEYDVKSLDSLMLLVFGIILSVVLGASAALGGTWAGSRFFQSPIPVVIVEETPLPASQSETGSNEP